MSVCPIITVVFEVVYTLTGVVRTLPKDDRSARLLLPLLELSRSRATGERPPRASVFDLYVERDLPFATAYHLVEMAHADAHEIVSFDPTFDTIEGVQRVKM